MAETDPQAKYVYGVVRAEAGGRVEGTGIGDEPLNVVVLDSIAALTSDVAAEPLEAGRAELLAHAHALEVAFEHGPVLPMRFGVVMESEDEVRSRLLEGHREELGAQLDEFEGAVEINLRGIYDEEMVLREVIAENREAAELREVVRGSSEEATYPERIRLGELISEALEIRRETDGAAIAERLSSEAIETDVGEPMHERMAVSASFLVARDRLEAFDRKLDEIADEQQGRIRFKYTGPLPPHSFVELSLES